MVKNEDLKAMVEEACEELDAKFQEWSQYAGQQLNEMQGSVQDIKDKVLAELQQDVVAAKKHIHDYLIDKLDQYLRVKADEMMVELRPSKVQPQKAKPLADYTGVIRHRYWAFTKCGGRLILGVLCLPLALLGVVVASLRKANDVISREESK